MAHFLLVTADGERLGTVELIHVGVPIGAVITRGEGPNVRVVGVILEEHPKITTLVVEPI